MGCTGMQPPPFRERRREAPSSKSKLMPLRLRPAMAAEPSPALCPCSVGAQISSSSSTSSCPSCALLCEGGNAAEGDSGCAVGESTAACLRTVAAACEPVDVLRRCC